MTDFLDRLINRVNGQASAIKPMVRSSYGSGLQINESAGEFEETVTFEEAGAGSPLQERSAAANLRTPAGRVGRADQAAIAGSETQSLIARQTAESAKVEPHSSRQAGRQSAGGKAAQAPAKTGGKGSASGKGAMNRARPDGAPPPIAQNISRIGNAAVQRKPAASVAEPPVVSPKRGAFAQTAKADRGGPLSAQSISGKRIAGVGESQSKELVQVQSLQDEYHGVPSSGKSGSARSRRSADVAALSDERDVLRAGKSSVRGMTVINEIAPEPIASRQSGESGRSIGIGQAASAGGRGAVGGEAANHNRKKDLLKVQDEHGYIAFRGRPEGVEATSTTRQASATIADSRTEAKTAAQAATYGMIEPRRRSVFEARESRQAAPDEVGLPSSNLSPDLVTKVGDAPTQSAVFERSTGRQSAPEYIVRQPSVGSLRGNRESLSFRNDADDSTNIRVTIGRVEIRAVQQPETRVQRPPSAPRKPAVSLDAYLKGRDEGRR